MPLKWWTATVRPFVSTVLGQLANLLKSTTTFKPAGNGVPSGRKPDKPSFSRMPSSARQGQLSNYEGRYTNPEGVALPKSHDLSGSRTAAIRPSSLLPDRSSPPLVRSSPVPIIKPSSIFPPRPIKPIPERKLTTDDRLQTLPNGLTATLSSQQLFIECDGSCIDNGYSTARASIGVNFGRASPYNIAEYVPRSLPQTNQVAELWAAIQAVKKGRVLVRTGHLRGLIIATDSQYVYEGITNWIWNWRRNGFLDFHGKPVKNAGLFRELHGLVEGMEGEGGVVHFVKIRGEINKRADRLATSMHKRNLSHRKGR